MEQPRLGGVALPPLSSPDVGEGTSPQSIRMEPTELGTLGSHDVTQDRRSDAGEADSDVQRVMEVLHHLGIFPCLERHKVKQERQKNAEAESMDNGVYCKNLLLKDKKGQAFLIVCEENDTADLHVVKYHLNVQGNLHFASKESLLSLLRVKPGAVSPLALIHSPGGVRIFFDASLMRKIDRDLTELYFHPMKADLQVGLTLTQLEKFLHHCDITLEKLPSLTSYSAGRRYTNIKGGCRYKHRPSHEDPFKNNQEVSRNEEKQEGELVETISRQMTGPSAEKMELAENTFTQHSDLFQQLGVNVKVAASADGNKRASGDIIWNCRSIYFKDKRENYFMFICHENQKIDFSALKMQLKPRKKILPLDREELWSLLHLFEYQEHPFSLAQLKQPRFLVAISNNLHDNGNAILAFPHPTDGSLRLQITLKHLQTFISQTSHDLTTIHMKGNIEELQAFSGSPDCFSFPRMAQQNKHTEAENSQLPLPSPVDKKHCQLLPDQNLVHASTAARQGNNLFYRATAPLRNWLLQCLRNLVQILDRYLPSQIPAVLHRLLPGDRTLTSGDIITEDSIDQKEEHTEATASTEKERRAKIEKLHKLIERSGIQVELTETQPLARFLEDDAERCKTVLLNDGQGRSYVVFCTEEENPSQGRNFRRFRRASRPGCTMHQADDSTISHQIPCPGDTSMSWTREDLNPLALVDMNFPQSLGRVRVGMTGALYSFPDTKLCFDLPPLGVSLRMNNDDLDNMAKQLGFCVVYLS
ncbi:uncharacterized protein LOC143301331 [Babylonia areolata]|uniref:uncharacterized protein LOC143301331 n=1 Tax=Babylonia areolata TaxID=304850 RepID=UPI003FD29A5B